MWRSCKIIKFLSNCGIEMTILIFSRPCSLKNSIFHLDPKCSPEENELFAQVAKDNWENILLCRAKELVPGMS